LPYMGYGVRRKRPRKLQAETLTRLLLEKIGELGAVAFDVFFPRKYSYARVSRRLFGVDDYPRAAPRTVSSLLSRLRREGLVARRGKAGQYRWSLTQKGSVRLKSDAILALPEPDGISRLVIFDIPERERKKRDIVRAELIACRFQQLQKSVWIGTTPLPEDFMVLTHDLGLKGKVHIFSIRESGTIRAE